MLRTPEVKINCPVERAVPTEEGVNYTTVTWDEPSAEGGAGLVNTTSSHMSGMTFYLGITTVIYSTYASDERLVAQCNFTIDVIGK